MRPSVATDAELDAIYPESVRKISAFHWTPVDVARRAAKLLAVGASTRVLDVGSGIGKFCLVGAMVTPGTFVGVEQRESLVEIAREAASRCGITRVEFRHANALAIDWNEFDAFYLFNPFSEHIFHYDAAIEEPIALSETWFIQYVTATSVKLFSARPGTRVVTYHGYGGPMPAGYRRLSCEPAGTDALELWEKQP
jgi:predicted RNA methylase